MAGKRRRKNTASVSANHMIADFMSANYTLTNLMHHPHIRLDVNTFILFDVHLNRVERAGDDVLTALGKFHARPLLPIRRACRGSIFDS